MAKMSLAYDGILSHDCQQNPDFCMWNVVAFLYCDGGSFLGKGFCCFSLHIYFFREKVDKREKKNTGYPDILVLYSTHLLRTNKWYAGTLIFFTRSSNAFTFIFWKWVQFSILFLVQGKNHNHTLCILKGFNAFP